MTAYFSCSAYQHYPALVKARKNLAAIINEALGDKTYGDIHFLVVHFSALTLVEDAVPEFEGDGALSFVVHVEGTEESDLARALLKGMDGQLVPEALKMDLEQLMIERKWS